MNTGNYTKLEIFARATEEGGGVRVVSGKGDCRESGGSAYYRWIRMPVEKDTEYEILCEGCQISLCYLSGCENILDKGVCYLEQKNGLCWFQGDYHMFYQFNPHGQKWSHMYWGHAASKELIHWTHLPVVLEPQREILDHPEKLAGGAFSGSAVVRGEEVVFFLTRSLGPCNDDENTVQQQWVMRSRDMLHFTQEELVIGALMQHRDSYGRYQMSRYYVGDFTDGIFTEESRGWFDFGGNCYAMQSFSHEGRRISIGWISDLYGEHLEEENGVCGSMTIPRVMHVRDNRLYLTPVKEIESLRK